MATHAPALHEQVATEVKSVRTLGDAIFCVTLLTAGLSVFFLKHRPEPEPVATVTFFFACRRAPIAPVTTHTTKLVDLMDFEQLAVWVTYKRSCKWIRIFSRTARRHVRRL